MTLRDLGYICGVSAQAVKKWEDGLCYPSSVSLIGLCKALDCSVEWLFDPRPLDFHGTYDAPNGVHAKYWVRLALDELAERRAMDLPE